MRSLPLVLALVALVAACASGPTPGPDTPVDETDSPAPVAPDGGADGVLTIVEGQAVSGPGISVDEALAQAGGEQPLLVNGSLFVDADGGVLLCAAIAESFPPQCGGTRLEVRGLDPESIPELQEANGVRWLDAIQLLGTVEAS